MKTYPTVLGLLLWHTLSFSQPLSIFGFEFGKPISLPECPYKLYGGSKSYEIFPPTTCIQDAHALNGYGQPVRRITFSKQESPLIVKNWTAFPLEANGVLIGLHFLTPGLSAQEIALSQLKQKYGEPTRSGFHQVQNAMGATYESQSATWETNALRISFEGMTTRIETGEIIIDTPEATVLRSQWEKALRADERKL